MKKSIQVLFFSLGILLATNFYTNAQVPVDTAEIIRISNMGDVTLLKQQILPIQIWSDMILIKAKVNGIEGYFVWDNGFAFSALDKNFAAKIKLSPLQQKTDIAGTDGNNAQISMQCELGRVDMGQVSISGSPFTIIDFEAMMGKHVKPVGIIGSTVIKKMNWKFDFDKNTVTLALKPFESNGIKLPFEMDAYNNSKILFGLNGYLDKAAIDFGYNGNEVAIPKDALPIFGAAKKSISIGHLSSSVSGLSDRDTSYIFRDFKYCIGDTNTVLPHKFEIMLSSNRNHVLIGNRFFRNYNCIINNTSGQIILTTRKSPINVIPEKKYGAILSVNDGKILVSSFSDNPNINRNADLKLMDEIESINGKSLKDFADPSQIRDYQISLLLKNMEMKLKRIDGKIFVFKPEPDIYK
ncbi:aspartyl protease family protein [Pedobacter sp. 22226]|uniref:aspartyl protease family protein n=1 Tax=Pedobacter sp. 22226 TaxID=3453894 RepID=UPI003F86E963